MKETKVNPSEGTKTTRGSDDGDQVSPLDRTKINRFFVFGWALSIALSFLQYGFQQQVWNIL